MSPALLGFMSYLDLGLPSRDTCLRPDDRPRECLRNKGRTGKVTSTAQLGEAAEVEGLCVQSEQDLTSPRVLGLAEASAIGSRRR